MNEARQTLSIRCGMFGSIDDANDNDSDTHSSERCHKIILDVFDIVLGII